MRAYDALSQTSYHQLLYLRSLSQTLVVTFGFWVLSTSVHPVLAESQSEQDSSVASAELQAAFVYNLMMFSHWPNSKAERVLCTAGQNRDSLNLTGLNGQLLNNTPVRVQRIVSDTELSQCDALFIASLEFINLPYSVEGLPILVFSNLKQDYMNNVAVTLSNLGSRVIFDVNLSLLKKSGIRLGASVLRLAHSTL